jgi:hypothetical protein
VTGEVIDMIARRKQKEVQHNLPDIEDYDDLHEICTNTANELINNLYNDYDINISTVEYSPEMIFFFEAYKGLVMKCVDQWHPFQDMAAQFMEDQGIVIEEYEGGYRFVLLPDEEPEPANDE